jgi:hypothetical protein
MVSKVERDSKMEGRRMTLVLQPDHKQPGAKQPGTAGTAPAAGKVPTAFSAGTGLNIPRPAAVAAAPATAPVKPVVAAPPIEPVARAQAAPAGSR